MILPWEDEDYLRFRTTTASLFPFPLPPERPASRLLTFDGEGRPVPLPATTTLNITLGPFFRGLGLDYRGSCDQAFDALISGNPDAARTLFERPSGRMGDIRGHLQDWGQPTCTPPVVQSRVEMMRPNCNTVT